MKKNVAGQTIDGQMFLIADGLPFTGVASVSVKKDNGVLVAGLGPVPVHAGQGNHGYAPTQAETNGERLSFVFSGSGAATITVQVYTAFPQTVDNDVLGQATKAVADGIQTDLSNTTDGLGAIKTGVNAIDTTPMRGTDGANTITPPTVIAIRQELDTSSTQLAAIVTDTGTAIPATIATLQSDTDDIQTRVPTVAQLAYIVENAKTGKPVTFTTTGGSTTAAVLNLVDALAASGTTDQYKGHLLVFSDGTLKDVVTDITGYDGATKVATITAIPFAPTATHNARLL